MTRDRLFGSDVAVMSWCREKARTGELPAYSEECGVVQTDVDAYWHRYKTCVDRIGTRELQLFMEIEWKTRGGELTKSQEDTYRKKHATTLPMLRWHGQELRNYGIAVVRLSGTTPDDSEWIKWGRFIGGQVSGVIWSQITVDQLIQLIRFDLHPDTLKQNTFRRHHKTGVIHTIEKSDLGFEVVREIVQRS